MHITTLECALMIETWEHRWEELKKYIEYLKNDPHFCYPDVHMYRRLLDKMKELEEK